MISKYKEEDVKKVVNYVKNHTDLYDKLIVFNSAVKEDDTADTTLDIAIKMRYDEDAEDDIKTNTAYQDICELVTNNVNVFIINDPDLADCEELFNQINKGETVYG